MEPNKNRNNAPDGKDKAKESEKAKEGGRPFSSGAPFRALEAASFLCGAAVMVLEMAGSRLVAPYMGTSLIVWTSLIGVIMASLSSGYWLGGVVADQYPERKVLARIVLFASLFTGGMAMAANPVLEFLSEAVDSVYSSSVAAALLLFAVPSVLLGMVSPFIVRLSLRDVGSSGSTVGRFSALSSAGSILGTFLGGFVLISLFASGTILLLVAGTLAFVGFLLHRPDWKGAALLGAIFFALAAGTKVRGMPMMPVGEHTDTRYNHIWVAEQTRGDRRMRLLRTAALREGAQSIIYTDRPAELFSDYTQFYDLAFHYKPDAKNILMLGGGGYCVPRHLLATRLDGQGLPAFSMDVVEIDPGITETARKYFFLEDSPALTIHHEDARIYLNRAGRNPALRGSYDAIFADVFGSWYAIPFHLATVETAQAMSDLMASDGVLISNIISALQGPQSGVLHGIYAALSQVFPHVLIFPATRPDPAFARVRQNVMLVAFKGDVPARSPQNPETSSLLSHRWTQPFTPEIPAFTDAFAPVEVYALKER